MRRLNRIGTAHDFVERSRPGLRERGRKTLLFVGLAFDFCVRYSAEDARRAGFDAVVIEEACRGIDVDGSVAAAHHSLKTFGIPTVGIEAFF